MGLVHYDIIVRGRVQGVWYRRSAVETAGRLGLTGFAMNHLDGTVRMEAEGTLEQMEKFLAWCAVGPPLAEVMHVERVPGRLKGYSSFEVRR